MAATYFSCGKRNIYKNSKPGENVQLFMTYLFFAGSFSELQQCDVIGHLPKYGEITEVKVTDRHAVCV